MTHDLNEMVSNPSAYGFEWGFGPLHKNGMEICKAAPYIVHKDFKRLCEVFGDDYFLASANGQSARVRDQLLRNDIWDNKSLANDTDAMKRIVLERALGTRARKSRVTIIEREVQVKVYVADDGTEFTDKAEYLAYQVDLKLNA